MNVNTDLSWDQLDRLVESYAAAVPYVLELKELELRLTHAISAMRSGQPTISDFSALLSGRPGARDEVTRKVAWAAQHILGARAWSVGQKLVLKRGYSADGQERLASPLLAQLEFLGHRPVLVDFSHPADETPDELAVNPNERLDALLVSSSTKIVHLVQGVSYAQARKAGPQLWVNSDKHSLFSDGKRFMTRLRVPRASVATLLAARSLLRACLPSAQIKAHFMVINDPGCSWHFQLHDLTETPFSDIATPNDAPSDAAQDSQATDPDTQPAAASANSFNLDLTPVSATFRDFPDFFPGQNDALDSSMDRLPNWGNAELTTLLPADRPSRSLMMLSELWSLQANKPDKLVFVKGSYLAQHVQDRCGIIYPKDAWRHDLEDCLERGRLIRRSSDGDNCFAIVPKGVARLLLLKHKYHRSASHLPSLVMKQIAHLARLWATAQVV